MLTDQIQKILSEAAFYDREIDAASVLEDEMYDEDEPPEGEEEEVS